MTASSFFRMNALLSILLFVPLGLLYSMLLVGLTLLHVRLLRHFTCFSTNTQYSIYKLFALAGIVERLKRRITMPEDCGSAEDS